MCLQRSLLRVLNFLHFTGEKTKGLRDHVPSPVVLCQWLAQADSLPLPSRIPLSLVSCSASPYMAT
jgi:hypothetical protein